MTKDDTPTARRFYDRISHAYDLIADSSEHKARERGLELLAPAEGERVLEIGFGTGHSLEALARAVGPGGRVAGVDISSGMREVASRRLERAGLLGRVELEVCEVPPLPYDDAAFDAVTLSFTLELFPAETIPRVLAEIRRVLVPGGRLGVVAMATAAPGEKDSLLERGYKWAHHHFPHIVDCRPIDAAALVAEAGFELTGRDDLAIWTLPVVALAATAGAPTEA